MQAKQLAVEESGLSSVPETGRGEGVSMGMVGLHHLVVSCERLHIRARIALNKTINVLILRKPRLGQS